MFLPNLFFALAWLANVSSLPPLRRTLLVILCCAASSFCFANGLLQWFLVPPLTFGLSRAQKIRVWSLHFSAALVCFVFYFVGYKSPAEHQLGAGLSHKLGRIIAYFLAWLGSSLSEGSLLLAQISGAVLLLSFLCLMLLYLKNWRTAGLRAEWLPWLSMGCYALISGFLAALGRSHIGLEQALRPRYCTISQWFIIGSLGLSVTLLGQNWERKPAGSRLGLALLALISGAFIWFAARHEILAAQEWRTFSESMHFQKQSFGLERERPGQLWTFQIPVDKKAIVSVAYNEMEKAGFLHNFYRSNKILPLITAHKTGSPREGEVTLATYLPTREIICRGWSVGGDAQAGNRVLVVLIFDGSGKVLAVADGPIDQNREDIIRTKRAASDKLAGFTLQFRVPKMNPGVYRLAAFRYGKDEQTYYPIGVPKPLNIPG